MNYVGKSFCAVSTASKLQKRRNAHTAFGEMIAKGLAILLLSALALPLAAQEARWNELIKQASTLRDQQKYADAITVTKEAVQVAERTFGADDQKLAFSLGLLGLMYYAQGKYAEAEPLFKRSLAIYEKALGPDHLYVATSLRNLAQLAFDQGKYGEAEPLLKRSLVIREKALGPDHPDVATSLRELAGLYMQQGKYAEAEPLLKRSLVIREKALGPDHREVATSLNSLAELYYHKGKYDDAEPLFKRSLAILEKALGPDHPEVAKSIHNLAFLYQEQGKYAEAEPLLKRSLVILEKALGPDHREVATSLLSLAELYYHKGKYADAEPLFKRSLAIREKALGPDHPEVAKSLHDLASLYWTQGKYAEAEPLYKRSLAIREKALGQDHPNVATDLRELAGLYMQQGKYAEAEPLLKRSLVIREKALEPDHPDVAGSLDSLATLYSNLGKYAEAEPLYKRSLAIREKALGPHHPDVATSLNDLAVLNCVQGKYAEAEPLLKRSLVIREKALGPDHPEVAASLNSLGSLYWTQGKYAEAEPLYKRSLAIREKALGQDHPNVATDLNNLATLYWRQGKYAEAEPLYKRSLAILEKALGPEYPNVARSLNNLSLLYWTQGKYAEAEDFFERGLQNLSKQFENSFTYMSEKDRLQFLNTVRSYFDSYLSFCLTHGQEDPALVGRMYDLLLWEKGMVGTSVAALRAHVAAGGDTEALKIFDQLAAKKSELVRLASTRPQGWEELRKTVEEEANDLEQQLARRVNSLSEHKNLAHASWRDVQQGLQPGEAAVEFVRFMFFDGKQWTDKFKYVALVVTPKSRPAPTLVSLGEAKDLEADPLRDYRLRVGLRASGSARSVRVTTQEENIGAAPKVSFYDAFWKPLEPPLNGINRIYLSPDGVLNQVALGDVAAGDGRLLMESYDLRIVSSTKDILRGTRKASTNTAVLIGNPSFDLDESQQRSALRSLQAAPAVHPAPAAVEVATLRSRDLRSGTLNPLPGTQVEVEAVSSLLEKQHWQVQTYTQQHALKESVMKVKGPRVLHLATHGFFEPDQQTEHQRPESDQPSGLEDPMLRSGLFFAGANRHLSGHATPPDLDDGVLTAYEATQLNLRETELVVLSACETGLGKVTAGEGVFGLRRALQVAGAESVLMSMWSVPDKETQELMTLFYTKWLSGKDKHEALREAQLEMRERVKARYGKDLPQYWGAFVLVGR
jgi:CHAT domain-containing protein/tetratricopeptide (TPR) repeat protein